MPARFEILTGREAGRVYDLPDDATWIIGRGKSSDIVCEDSLASRSHVKIECIGGSITVRDLGSRNGTFRNGRRIVEPQVLEDGDRIQVGETVFRFALPKERQEAEDLRLTFCSRCYRAVGPETFRQGRLEERRFICPECLDGKALDPKAIPGFEITGRLGAGKLGPVFRARHLRLAKDVALKVLTPEETVREKALKRFLREARIGGRLYHPNIIEMYDAAVTPEGIYYLSMELVNGTTLVEAIDKDGRLPPDAVRRIGRDLAAALACAHGHGLVHRNIRPANIFIDRSGMAKLGDFGLARAIDDTETNITVPGQGLGTLFYTAPEQIQDASKADARSDIFSVGAVLYHAITGAPPFHDKTAGAVLRRLAQGDITPVRAVVPDAAVDLADAIARCLKIKPDERFQTAADLGAALGGEPLPPPDWGATTQAPDDEDEDPAGGTVEMEKPPPQG